MKRSIAMLVLAFATISLAQEEPAFTATATPEPLPTLTPNPTPQKRGWFGRILHPFSSKKSAAAFKDPKLRGLTLDLEISPQTVKLSEIRQLEIKLTVTNRSKRAVTLDFPNDQRIDIHLMNSAEVVLTRWSDTHAIEPKPGIVLINPQEHVEYNQTIATRDLTPNKVFSAEVFFPKYPELRVRQKFLTAP
jgi:Intracellular proteinase inhibitor